MTAFESPPLVVPPQRLPPTQAELDSAEAWIKQNVKPTPVIPPFLTNTGNYFPITAKKLISWHRTGHAKGIVEAHNRGVTLMEQDPLIYGYVPDCWKDLDECVNNSVLTCLFGGGGSSKSRASARLGVRKMLEKPNARVLWLHENQENSIVVQQKFVYDYLPGAYKRRKQRKSDRITKINYSLSTGFLAGPHHMFALPNGSLGVFNFYSQDVKVCEGHGWDLVLADEDLPLGWLKTLMFRLPRQNGKMVWAFSPIRGITPAIKAVVSGAKTVRSLPAEMLDSGKVHVPGSPPGHMPYLQESSYCNAKILYFFTSMNPWAGYEMQKSLAIKNKSTIEDIERRFYGWSRDTIGKQFPKFGPWNVVTKIPEDVTRYVIKDPGPGRNAFVIWVAVDRYKRHYIYREWPDVPTYGEWAVASENARKYDGDPGPAQIPLGMGVRRYKEMMLKAEGNKWNEALRQWDMCGEKIFIRYGDPRAFAAPSGVEESAEGSAMFDRYREVQEPDDKNEPIGPSMDFLPAPGYHIERGIEMINNLLDKYNPNEPVTALLNEPGLFIHESCRNMIWAMHNWTWRDGDKGASKDPVDVLRYAATADLQYVDPKMKPSYGGGSY